MTALAEKRRRVAVLAADVAGYTRLMEAAEGETHRRFMRAIVEVVEPAIARHGGRIVKNTGDGFLAAFDIAIEAARCALSAQAGLAQLLGGDDGPTMLFRMGLNVAEVIVEPHDIFGDGVNIAARLQSYAEPGGLVISGAAAAELIGEPGFALTDLGEFFPRNLSRPVRAFTLRAANDAAPLPKLRGLEATERPSIAVLPFRDAGSDGVPDYFADGIIEGIIDVLTGIDGLAVIAQSSSLAYAGAAIDIRAIGRELGVRYVLRGSVQRAGVRLRIATALCDAEDGSILRTHRYDGAMDQLFDLQDEIAVQVVTTIAPQVRQRELTRAMRKHADSMTAYDLVLQALDQFHRLDQLSFGRARALLQQAIALDPDYAMARAYAGFWHLVRVGQGWSPDDRADVEAALRETTIAVDIDGSDALALAVKGHVLAYLVRDYHGAMPLLDQAIAVGPNNAIAWLLNGFNCGYLGFGARAVLCAERSLRLSPFDPLVYWHEHCLSQAHYLNGNHEEAISWGQRSYIHNASFTSNLRLLIAAQVATGRIEDAQRMARRLLELDPSFVLSRFAARTPLQPPVRDDFVQRLRAAGLPH